jgi:tRNA pseudouridine38-40 synthase
MARYFIQVAYKGTNYAGFQIQNNANSIQAEIEKALKVYFRTDFMLTCSSRTDAGVHALSNYFHFDAGTLPDQVKLNTIVYNLNAILPGDIVIKRICQVPDTAHSRFDALYREYCYYIYKDKNPFQADRAYYYPYTLDMEKLQEAAALIMKYTDFTAFSKRNTQVKTFNCMISKSRWIRKDDMIIYNVQANRFLRGMVKGLVGTMLRVGSGKTGLDNFRQIIESKDCSNADFSVAPHALFLVNVQYPDALFIETGK